MSSTAKAPEPEEPGQEHKGKSLFSFEFVIFRIKISFSMSNNPARMVTHGGRYKDPAV